METLIQGAIGENVDIEVDIEHSCNVYLADDEATATLDGANLIATIIDGVSSNAGDACLTGCMNVNIKDSANIIGKAKENDVTLTGNTELEVNSVFAECLTNAHIGIHKRHVANIIGVRDVTVQGTSQLSDDNVLTASGETQFTTITGHISNVATIHASRFVTITGFSTLIDDLVDLTGGAVTGTTVHIEGHNVGSVVAGGRCYSYWLQRIGL